MRADRRLMAAALAGLLLWAGPAAADFEAGVVAIQRERFDEAEAEFEAAHAAGDARGTFMLGVMREYGWGAPADDAAAADWYRQAAEAGLSSAQFNLGILYQAGRGVEEDQAQAASWFAKAADQGHARAMNNLGSMFDSGTGVPQDSVEALKWFTLAADGLKDQDLMITHDNILSVEARLDPAQVAEARARAQAWRATRR